MNNLKKKINEDLEAFSRITLPQSVLQPIRCTKCNKPLPKRHIVHKNICQEPPEHKFCSRECKDKWCAEHTK